MAKKTIAELYRFYGDLPADKAHARMKTDNRLTDIPSRGDVRKGWKELRSEDNAFVGVFETECGVRFLSRQGRWRFCKRTGAIPIKIREIKGGESDD